jgi:tyrosinase
MAAASVAAYPFRNAFAQPAPQYLRRNISAKDFPAQVLTSYGKAIAAMLKLPPTDPRNWYRNAFIHTLDCPHGNWWFPVWHRGYLGWFERTCRDLSGDPNFALPFWDWTATPRIPKQFFQGVLNPANPAYISSYNAFNAQLSNPMSALWQSFSADQVKEQSLRGYSSINDVWAEIQSDPMFVPPPQARGLTASHPNFDSTTKNAVSLNTILRALAPLDYVSFASDIAPYHSKAAGFGILEGQPHNNVHNCISGLMEDMLSPIDPLFFMHHSNIDRLWDCWTRKQQKLNLPTLPTGSDLQPWTSEPFLFFRDQNGNPVLQNTAGDYATIGQFDYSYQSGSGEDAVSNAVPQPVAAPQSFPGGLTSHALALGTPAQGQVAVPESLLQAASQGSTVFARVTIQNPPGSHGVRFNVFVNPPAGSTAALTPDSPSYAATLEFFGAHHHDEPVAFTVPISDTLKTLAAKKLLKANEPLRIVVVPETAPGVIAPHVPGGALSSSLANLSVGTF